MIDAGLGTAAGRHGLACATSMYMFRHVLAKAGLGSCLMNGDQDRLQDAEVTNKQDAPDSMDSCVSYQVRSDVRLAGGRT